MEKEFGAHWNADDKLVRAKLATLEAKFGKKPNIIYMLVDEVGYRDKRDEYVVETSYKFQLLKGFPLLPNVQLLLDPANSPEDDQFWVFGYLSNITEFQVNRECPVFAFTLVRLGLNVPTSTVFSSSLFAMRHQPFFSEIFCFLLQFRAEPGSGWDSVFFSCFSTLFDGDIKPHISQHIILRHASPLLVDDA